MRHLIAPSSMPEIDPDLDPIIVTEGDARSSYKAEPQPPRYTISRRVFGPRVIHALRF